jgi:hypothetical protein
MRWNCCDGGFCSSRCWPGCHSHAVAVGRSGAGWQRHNPVRVGRGDACPFSAGSAALDPRRAGGPHADASGGEAVPGPRFDSGGRAGSVRGRGGFGAPAAQLGLGRSVPHWASVRRRCPERLAPPYGAANDHLVCGTCRGAVEALAGRVLVWLCQPAAVPVPAATVVFPAVYLGAVSLTGLAPRPAPRAHVSGPCGGVGFLSNIAYAFQPLLLAQGALYAGIGVSANRFHGFGRFGSWLGLVIRGS